jgi:phosphatidylglycerol---prolipoprotein diacylglyceryl transferase
MRPKIIDLLNQWFHTGIFNYVIPDSAVVYAVMVGVGTILFLKRCKKISLNIYHASGMAIWASVTGLIGARVFYFVQHFGYTLEHPETVFEINGATVSFGVYLGGVAGVILYSQLYKVVPWKYLDVGVSVLGLGPMIGRIACFLNGDDYGTVSTVPWAVRFPHGSYPFIDHVERGWITPMDDLSLPVHPVQLYGCLKGLALFILFSVLWKKNLFKPGVLFFLFWMCYSCCRFILEFFRGDMDRGWVGTLSTGQFMSVTIFGASLVCISFLYGRKIRNDDGLVVRFAR